jgi:hypothetical protein
VNNGRIIGGLLLIVVLSLGRLAFGFDPGLSKGALSGPQQIPSSQLGQKTTEEKKNGLEEMREWLNQRNLNRKQNGDGFPDKVNNSGKKYAAAPKPQLMRRQEKAAEEGFLGGSLTPRPSTGMFDVHSGRGPDVRSRHLLVMNEDVPDQLHVYSGSGYAVPNAAGEDAAKLARLTHRGKQAWMAGAYLRAPASYYPLKPKGWNHPKLGER